MQGMEWIARLGRSLETGRGAPNIQTHESAQRKDGDVSEGPSPTMRRRQLGMELRRLREASSMTIEGVASEVGRAASTVSRIETGKTGARPVHVRKMLELYGIPEGPEHDALLELAKDSQRRGWWSEYDDVISADFDRYLGYEGGAASLRTFENRVVLGLLQTADYARACQRAVRVYQDPDDIERLIEIRLKRQELLTRNDPMSLWCVLDEAVLHRRTGDPKVMHGQLSHLLTMGIRPNVTIQILPFNRGAHAGLDGPFTVIEFPTPSDQDVVYVDGPAGNIYLERPKDVRRHVGVFNRLLSEALTREESARMIEAVAQELQ
jgi:transcriptional regulator with XRE-family HTH domain